MFCGVILVLYAKGFELIAGFRGEGWTGPFSLGFEEEGEGIAADVEGVVDGIVDSYRVGLENTISGPKA